MSKENRFFSSMSMLTNKLLAARIFCAIAEEGAEKYWTRKLARVYSLDSNPIEFDGIKKSRARAKQTL